MINKELLNKELNDCKKDLKPMRYNRDFIFNLFRKYKNYTMTESSYCCYGEKQCCWQDVYDEGVWGLTLERVKYIIFETFKGIRHCLRSTKHGHRMYVFMDEKICHIYIYGRDIFEADYHICFWN